MTEPDPRWLAISAAVVCVLALVPAVAPPSVVVVVLRMVVLGLFAMAFNVGFGAADMPSLGHAALFGTGSYVAGLGLVRWGWGIGLVLVVAVVAGAVLGAVMGVATLRTRGIYLLLLTLAIGQAVWGLAFQQVAVTGGDNGIAGIPRSVLALGADGLVGTYWAALAIVVVAVALLYAFRISIVGTVVEGVGMSPSRLRALGFAVGGFRVTAFVVSGAFSALAGVLMALTIRFVGPESLAWQQSAEVMLFAILGGAASFAGPLVGVVVVVGAEVVVSDWTDRWPTVLGLLYVVTLLFLPDGVLGRLSRWRGGAPGPGDPGGATSHRGPPAGGDPIDTPVAIAPHRGRS